MIDLFTIDQKKYQTILGKIDIIDVTIIVNFNHIIYQSGMISTCHKGIDFFKVDYNTVIELLPILNIKKDAVYRRFKKLCDLNIFQHHPESQKLATAYYKLNSSYLNSL